MRRVPRSGGGGPWLPPGRGGGGGAPAAEDRVPAPAASGGRPGGAFETFPVSGVRMPLPVVYAAAMIKGFGAEVNAGLKLLAPPLAEAISRAAREGLGGELDDEFAVGSFVTR